MKKNLEFTINDKRGNSLELGFSVSVQGQDVEVLDVTVNGSFCPVFLEENFIDMIGLDKIEIAALEE